MALEDLRCLVEKANKNMHLMDGTLEPVKRLPEGAEIAVGVYQDPTERYGVGYLVLKGGKLLRECVASGENIAARVTAIPCGSYEQAVVAKEVLGDRDLDA
jgi:hypothetical protein